MFSMNTIFFAWIREKKFVFSRNFYRAKYCMQKYKFHANPYPFQETKSSVWFFFFAFRRNSRARPDIQPVS